MEEKEKKLSRRNFVSTGLAAAAVSSIITVKAIAAPESGEPNKSNNK